MLFHAQAEGQQHEGQHKPPAVLLCPASVQILCSVQAGMGSPRLAASSARGGSIMLTTYYSPLQAFTRCISPGTEV